MPTPTHPDGTALGLIRENLSTVRDDLVRAIDVADVRGALSLVVLWAAWIEAGNREGLR